MIIKNEDGTELEVFTAEEVQSQISKAVNGAVQKAKEKASKSSEERIAELEATLALRDRQDYARTKMAEAHIDPAFASFFNGKDNEAIDQQIESFSTAWKTAIDSAVKEELSKVSGPRMKPSEPDSGKGRRTLAQINESLNGGKK